MVVEETGIEHHIARPALGVVVAHDAVLIEIADRYAEGQEACLTADAQVVVGAISVVVDLVVPVGIVIAEECALGVGALGGDGIDKLVAAHHVHHAGARLQAVGRREGHLRFAAATLLGRDDDDAVRGARTIYSRRRGILEHRHALDVVGVDQTEEIAGIARDATALQWYAVEHDQRVVAGIERGTATDADGGTGCGRSAVGHDLHTGDLTVDQLFGRGDQALVKVLRLDRRDRSREVAAACGTVTDDHHLIEVLLLRLQLDGHVGRHIDGLRFVTDVAHDDLLHRCRKLKREVAVEVGHSALTATLGLHGSADERLTVGSVCNVAFDGSVLCAY